MLNINVAHCCIFKSSKNFYSNPAIDRVISFRLTHLLTTSCSYYWIYGIFIIQAAAWPPYFVTMHSQLFRYDSLIGLFSELPITITFFKNQNMKVVGGKIDGNMTRFIFCAANQIEPSHATWYFSFISVKSRSGYSICLLRFGKICAHWACLNQAAKLAKHEFFQWKSVELLLQLHQEPV